MLPDAAMSLDAGSPSHNTRRTVAKIFVQGTGTLAGLFGAGILVFVPLMPSRSLEEAAILPLLLAAYLIYVACLVWFRLSPRAVRHVCGILGFCVLMLILDLLEPRKYGLNAIWPGFVFAGSLVAVYIGYRVASYNLSHFLFPEYTAGV
ncbi:MAG: hypothetical protein IT365_06980 [Candidatus Hydrogenedentes bacterium]|nr:hypothetical protein [Candidatus Hydrogenedentota bacterium]